VKIAELRANGSTLIVPTTLDPTERARAGQICSELLGWHKGWDPVTVEDMNGDMLTGCIA
jgi:hypothetical protein